MKRKALFVVLALALCIGGGLFILLEYIRTMGCIFTLGLPAEC